MTGRVTPRALLPAWMPDHVSGGRASLSARLAGDQSRVAAAAGHFYMTDKRSHARTGLKRGDDCVGFIIPLQDCSPQLKR